MVPDPDLRGGKQRRRPRLGVFTGHWLGLIVLVVSVAPNLLRVERPEDIGLAPDGIVDAGATPVRLAASGP